MSADYFHSWPLCARPIFIATRAGSYVEPLELRSSLRRAELRREGNQQIAAFDLGLTPSEKMDLARVGIPAIPFPSPIVRAAKNALLQCPRCPQCGFDEVEVERAHPTSVSVGNAILIDCRSCGFTFMAKPVVQTGYDSAPCPWFDGGRP